MNEFLLFFTIVSAIVTGNTVSNLIANYIKEYNSHTARYERSMGRGRTWYGKQAQKA